MVRHISRILMLRSVSSESVGDLLNLPSEPLEVLWS